MTKDKKTPPVNQLTHFFVGYKYSELFFLISSRTLGLIYLISSSFPPSLPLGQTQCFGICVGETVHVRENKQMVYQWSDPQRPIDNLKETITLEFASIRENVTVFRRCVKMISEMFRMCLWVCGCIISKK